MNYADIARRYGKDYADAVRESLAEPETVAWVDRMLGADDDEIVAHARAMLRQGYR